MAMTGGLSLAGTPSSVRRDGGAGWSRAAGLAPPPCAGSSGEGRAGGFGWRVSLGGLWKTAGFIVSPDPCHL